MEYRTEKNRIVYAEGDRELGYAEFPQINAATVKVTHTFVDESLRGQGVAAKLMAAMADSLRESGRRAVPECEYAVKWFEQHDEYSDVLVK